MSIKCLSPTVEESPPPGHTPHRHENLPMHHPHRNPLNHRVSGSDIISHTVKSSLPIIRNDEEYLTGTPRTITPVRSPLSIKELSNRPTGEHPNFQSQHASPADKWKALTLASRASTESLARAAKERRLRRSPGFGFFRHTDECLEQRNRRPVTLNKSTPSKLSPEKKSVFESWSENSTSPTKGSFSRSRSTPRRTSSRPHSGAVRAMAALFDSAAKDSPIGLTAAHPGEMRRGSNAPSSIVSTHSGRITPTKSIKANVSPTASMLSIHSDHFKGRAQPMDTPIHNEVFTSAVNHSNTSLTSSKTAPGDLRSKIPHVSLRPTDGSFSTLRRVPFSSPTPQIPLRDRELSQPPSLGTMIPHQEEPPVAQHITFARPSPSASPGHYDGDDERISNWSPRPGSTNSILHVQIRHLQRQLEHRTEENTQLRRQLEARENMDIGKLCEQLRIARRESRMWHERAEAAEKRVAVFKQFTARLRGIRDSVALKDSLHEFGGEAQVDGHSHYVQRDSCEGSASSLCSGHLLDEDDLHNRIGQLVQSRGAENINGKSRSEDDDFCGRSSRTRRNSLWERKISGGQTAQLWDITEELLMLDENAE